MKLKVHLVYGRTDILLSNYRYSISASLSNLYEPRQVKKIIDVATRIADSIPQGSIGAEIDPTVFSACRKA